MPPNAERDFIKRIHGVFATRQAAIADEIRLHNEHDVARNPQFYNRAKQTCTGFDTAGARYTRKPGKTLSESHKAAIGESLRGKKQSAETSAKKSAATKGKPKSAETCARMSIAHTGIKRAPFTAEHIANMSAAQLRRNADK